MNLLKLPNSSSECSSIFIAFYQLLAGLYLGVSILEYLSKVISSKIKAIEDRISEWEKNLNKPDVQESIKTIDSYKIRFVSFNYILNILMLSFLILKVIAAKSFTKRCQRIFKYDSFFNIYFLLGIISVVLLLLFNNFASTIEGRNFLFWFNILILLHLIYVIISGLFNFSYRTTSFTGIVGTYLIGIVIIQFTFNLTKTEYIEFSDLLWESVFTMICFPLIHFFFLLVVGRINKNLRKVLEQIEVFSTATTLYGIDDRGIDNDDTEI